MKEVTFEIGSRYLLSVGTWHVFEAQILELSPSGKWVKLKYSEGDKTWAEVSRLTIEERLELTKKETRSNNKKPPQSGA